MKTDTSNEPLVSVITPTYNRWHVLPESVESVLNQTYQNWELIVVDDGSTDETRSVFNDHFGHDARVVFLPIENGGAAQARNIGARKAKGEYLAFLDSDDLAYPTWLENMVTAILKDDAALVSCGVDRYRANEKINVELPVLKKGIYHHFIIKMLGGAFMLRKDIFLTVGAYDPLLHSGQHTELGLRLTTYFRDHGLTTAVVNEPLIRVIDRGGASIRRNNEAVFAGSTHFLRKHHNYLVKENKNLRYFYLAIAGERGRRIGKYKEASHYTFEAWKMRPFNFKAVARLVRAYLVRLIKA